MSFGTGVFLLVVGAILAFAVKDSFEAVDLTVIGYICMAAGVLTLIIATAVTVRRSRSSRREVVEHRDANGDRHVVTDDRTSEPPVDPRV